MTISGYPVVGVVKRNNGDVLPLVDIPMMSDERWQELAKEQAVKNFIREHGYEPESVQQACIWQRERLAQMQ